MPPLTLEEIQQDQVVQSVARALLLDDRRHEAVGVVADVSQVFLTDGDRQDVGHGSAS